MNKKAKSTVSVFVNALSAKERKKFKEEHQELLLSELLLAAMQQDNISVRKLAKMAGVSPTVIQAMRSGTKKDFSTQSLFKILKSLGCRKFMVELNGQLIPLDISNSLKK